MASISKAFCSGKWLALFITFCWREWPLASMNITFFSGEWPVMGVPFCSGERGKKTSSRLVIANVERSDSGNYSCTTDTALPSTIVVFVSDGTLGCALPYLVWAAWYFSERGTVCMRRRLRLCLILTTVKSSMFVTPFGETFYFRHKISDGDPVIFFRVF